MMSYTMSCTCLCSSGSTLMRRTSPWTRIIGGSPADRCRSEALFLTENASSWVMSMVPGDKLGGIMATIPERLQEVRGRIAQACAAVKRPVQSVTLLAVGKTFDAAALREAHAAGQRAFGENYVQE